MKFNPATSSALLWICLLASGLCALQCENPQVAYEREQWTSPCKDEAVLLATTSGSPSREACLNRDHRMQVQVATRPSNEEAAALVFCRCVRHADIDAGTAQAEADAPSAPLERPLR